ncbi:DUF4817 domain-containing protein [Trichonephila clavipes]|nr:DUF4817 domain-containing protein [Trichonephila clavipes]
MSRLKVLTLSWRRSLKREVAAYRFVEWAQNEIAVVPDFHKRTLFSDEAHFLLNGYVSKQNCRVWSVANPQVYVETPLHPEKLTVWCALWAGGIIGPYFFKNDGHNVTVNGDRYRAMITNFFIPELNNHDVQELWFQQDGATYHTARATIDLLKDTFGDRLISRFGPVNWPPRSCDLTPLDYFLWGYVKSLVYADKPQTLDHLEDNIRRVIADIRPQMLEKVIENWTSRLNYIRASRGSHMPEIIFKMTATAGSDVVQSGRPIFHDFSQHLWPYIGNTTANVVFQMVKRSRFSQFNTETLTFVLVKTPKNTTKRKKDKKVEALSVAPQTPSAPTGAVPQAPQQAQPPQDSGSDPESEKNKKKKARTTFTGRQIFELEKQFEIKKYLSSSERAEMAKLLNVTETQVRRTQTSLYPLKSSKN